MRTIILALFLISINIQAYACSCSSNTSFYLHYNYVDKIFKGKIQSISTTPDGNYRSILFQIITKYKGDLPSDSISIRTGFGHGDCGLPVEVNDTWIIFSENGSTNICASNFLIERASLPENRHPWNIFEYKTFIQSLEEITTIENKYIKEYDSKKRLIAEGLIAKGKMQGYWSYYMEPSEDWPTKQLFFYKDGLKDSIEYEYYTNGTIYREQVWKNGKRNGKEIYYFKDGSIDIINNYSDDEKDGEWKTFYKNKQLREIEYYSKGKSVGNHISYYENGDTSSISYYNNEGIRTKCVGKYENGKTKWVWTYTYMGSTFVNESMWYYENGKIRSKTRSYHDEKNKYHEDGEQLIYYENGNLKEKRYYEMGKEVGIWDYYDENGELTNSEKKE